MSHEFVDSRELSFFDCDAYQAQREFEQEQKVVFVVFEDSDYLGYGASIIGVFFDRAKAEKLAEVSERYRVEESELFE